MPKKKKKTRAKAKKTDKFQFEDKYPSDTSGKHLKVYVKTDDGKDLLCDVTHYDSAGGYWGISASYSHEPEFIRDIDHQKFATKKTQL